MKNTQYLQLFKDNWIQQTKFGKTTLIFDNDALSFSNKDFDADILDEGDIETLNRWASELNLEVQHPVALFKDIAAIKRNPYKHATKDQLKYFNRACWLSLYKKGVILIEAFKSQFLPKIKKVHAIQQNSKLGDGENTIVGVIDMVLEIEGYDKPIIFDLKTSASPYQPDKIEITEQLTLYLAMEGQNYQTNLAGYVVLVKDIPKETIGICKKCGHTKDSRHKTCDNIVEGKRCGGEWDQKITPAPLVQVLVAEKTEDHVNNLLMDYNNVIFAMKQDIIYKNMDKCTNWFGSPCPYYNLCHRNSMEGLRKR